MSRGDKLKMIEERPRFSELYKLRKLAEDAIEQIESLAEGDDVVQRASDLLGAVEELYNFTRLTCQEEV